MRTKFYSFRKAGLAIFALIIVFVATVVLVRTSQSAIPTPSQWGYIDKSGKYVIAQQFDEAGKFSDGLAPVSINDQYDGKYGFIDHSGKFAITPRFDLGDRMRAPHYAEYGYHDGIAKIPSGKDKYSFIDKTGKQITALQFDQALDFHEGFAVVQLKNKWGFVNNNGQLVIPPRFDTASFFAEGLASVRIGQKWGFIDPAGKIVIPAKFYYTGAFSEGLAEVGPYPDHRGFVDKTGKIVIAPVYSTNVIAFPWNRLLFNGTILPFNQLHRTRVLLGMPMHVNVVSPIGLDPPNAGNYLAISPVSDGELSYQFAPNSTWNLLNSCAYPLFVVWLVASAIASVIVLNSKATDQPQRLAEMEGCPANELVAH